MSANPKNETFLAALAQHGNVTRACQESGASKASLHRLKAKDPAFAVSWTEAIERSQARAVETVSPDEPAVDVHLPTAQAEDAPDLDDLVLDLEDQITALEKERDRARADFPKFALIAQTGPGRTEAAGQAAILRATQSRCGEKIEELRAVLAEAQKSIDAARVANQQKRRLDVQRQIGPLLDQRDDLAAQLEKMLIDVAAVAKQLLQRGNDAWLRTRALGPAELAWVSAPDEMLIGQAIVAKLIEGGAVTTNALDKLAPVGFAGMAFSPGLLTVVANQKAMMLSRLPDLEATLRPARKPMKRTRGGDWEGVATSSHDVLAAAPIELED